MIKAGIVGGTGYTGVELLRLLARHPEVELTAITSRGEMGKAVDQLFPNLRNQVDLTFSAPDDPGLLACDVVFFATPHGVAQSMMKPFINRGLRVIDLSADFRLKDRALWEEWYGQEHGCPELIETAVYGLPELNRSSIRDAQLIACPGCYPTSVQLGLMPLLKAGCLDASSIVVNAASGISGAGKSANAGLLLAENSDSFKAYGVAGHRHLPEIEQGLRAMQSFDNSPAQVTFVPHLLPIIRGILSTIYVRLKDADEDIHQLYCDAYETEAFVDVLPRGMYPETRTVRGTNICRIGIEQPLQRDTLVIMSAIDNLAKGASAQAVQNMNLMFGFAEDAGLDQIAILP